MMLSWINKLSSESGRQVLLFSRLTTVCGTTITSCWRWKLMYTIGGFDTIALWTWILDFVPKTHQPLDAYHMQYLYTISNIKLNKYICNNKVLRKCNMVSKPSSSKYSLDGQVISRTRYQNFEATSLWLIPNKKISWKATSVLQT